MLEEQVPQSGEQGTFDSAQAESLVDSLRKTFRSGRTRSLDWRKQQLQALQTMLSEREHVFLDAMRADFGKPTFEAWASEISYSKGEAAYVAKHLDDWVKPEKVSTPLANKPGKSFVVHEPLGVVLVIAPWNYPLQLVMAPLIGAIAAGNCAVAKPSELTPHTSKAIAEELPKYVDNECLKIVEGGVPETQALLAQRWDHILYTGNGRVARIVMQEAAKHLTPVTLELGGKSPAIVDRNVDLELTARRLVWGKFFNAGQTCIAPDYVLADESIEQPLVEQMKSVIQSFYGDDPKQSDSYARIVNERHFERLTKALDESGGEIVAGGERDAAERYIAPTLLRAPEPSSPLMEEEIFGPILPVVRVPGVDAAIERVNAGPKPLALYAFSKDKKTARRIVDETSSGGACINDTLTHYTCVDLPFGGVGDSGIGAYHGRYSFETFSHEKGVLDRGTKVDPSLRYPPYDETKIKWAKKLL